MIKITYRVLTLTMLTNILLASSAFAQTTGTSDDTTTIPNHPRVNQVDQRLENQQDRIDQGVKNGQITSGQAAADENRLQKDQELLSKDQAGDNGHLTRAEQIQLNNKLGNNSNDILDQRHPIVADHPRVNEVDYRIQQQQQRVDQDLKSGKITAAQAAADKSRLQKDQALVSKDRAGDNGHITGAEQTRLNNQLNHNGMAVYDQSHPIDPSHPRVNEVDERLRNQEIRENSALKNGEISKQQYTRDQERDQRIQQKLSADQAGDNGHVTKAEQKQINKQLNHNSKNIYKQRHPHTQSGGGSGSKNSPKVN